MFNMYKGKQPFHIFLTGEKQVGKSTLVSAVLSKTGLKYKGMKSVSVFDDNGNRNVYLIPAEAENPDFTTLAGVCTNRHLTEKHPEVFDSAGLSLIEPAEDTQLLVIDEIGRIEKDASAYSQKVLSLLERTDIHVLGVLQMNADTPLAEAIRKHPNVKTFVIKETNRENLIPVVLRLLNEEERF